MFHSFRKIFLTHTGIVIFSTLCWYIIFSVLSGRFDKPFNVALSIIAGLLLGSSMWKRMNQDQSYFIENVKNDRLQETRNFKQLYKQMQLPTSKKDKAKFIKFLDTIENMHLRNVKQVWTLWLMSGLMLALVLFDRRLTLLNVGYSGVLILAFYGYFNSKKQLENIKVLRARLLQPT